MEDDSQAEVQGSEELKPQLVLNGKPETCNLKSILLVPNLRYFLISVGSLCTNRFQLTFSNVKE